MGMLPILLGAVVGYVIAWALGLVNFALVSQADWITVPNITLPAFDNPQAWGAVVGIALIAIATVPESTAHLYQMSLYIDQLAKNLGAPLWRSRNSSVSIWWLTAAMTLLSASWVDAPAPTTARTIA